MNILQMSFYGAVLILIISALRLVTRNKLPKKTFLVLWGVVMLRLLIPYELPSIYSVYSWIEPETFFRDYEKAPSEENFFEWQTSEENSVSDSAGQIYSPNTVEPIKHDKQIKPIKSTVIAGNQSLSENGFKAVLRVIWLSGALLLVVFFAAAYVRCNFEFKTSLPLENEFINRWLKEHKIRRTISVRHSDKITAPLTYGFIRPVILIPKNTDLENTRQLQYALLHEYVHIRRFDSVLKLVCVLTLCLHWFNPAVWLMYFLFNRDIELACDESTVKKLGLGSKAEYARMLIAMEEKKAGITPLCSGFGKNSVKERILAVMKMKKFSVLAVIGAVLITSVVAAVFATSAKPILNENNENYGITEGGKKETKIDLSDNSGNKEPVFSESDFEKMLALKFDNFEQMSIEEFQDKVWKMTDNEEYRELFDRFVRYKSMFYLDRNETAAFVFNTLFPLTNEQWRRHEFDGSFGCFVPDFKSMITIEYNIGLIINNPESITVGEYMSVRSDIPKGLEEALDRTTRQQYRDDDLVKEAIAEAAKDIIKLYESENLRIFINTVLKHEYFNVTPIEVLREEKEEKRLYPTASKSDYDSLLQLKTPGYENMTLKDFNGLILEWANEDFERNERINCDILYDDFAVEMSADDRSFVTLTVDLSETENGEGIRSNYTGRPEEDPSLYFQLASKTAERNGFAAWCDLYCGFSYHISDKETVTVGERDKRVGGMIDEINKFWDNTDIDTLLKMTEGDIVNKLKEMANKHSGGGITITVNEDQMGFERMDERGMETEIAVSEIFADPELYKDYALYGLTVNPDDSKLYFDGKLVRCFDDKVMTENFSVKAIGYCEKRGVIDVRAVRDGGKLIGLEVVSDEDFKNREIYDNEVNVDDSDFDGSSGSVGMFDLYAEYGLEYNAKEGAIFYEGERVRLFWDSLSADLQPSASESPFIVTVSNWDGKGTVDLYVVRDYKRKDNNGYGTITGLRAADQKEFERNTEIFGGRSGEYETA